MFIAYQYRLYPNKQQAENFIKTFDCTRFIYNKMLEDTIKYYETYHKHLSISASSYKKDYPWLSEVDSYALSNAWLQLKTSFNRYFSENSYGFPKFRTKKSHKFSYTTNNNPSKNNIRIQQNYIKLPKIGLVRAVIHRLPPDGSILKHATIKLVRSGKYYISMVYKVDDIVHDNILNYSKSLGLDYSSTFFFVDSQGKKANLPSSLSNLDKKIAYAQRKLSKMQRGSKNFEKQRIVIAKLYEKKDNIKKDWQHKLSNELAKKWDFICIEDLSLQGFMKNKRIVKGTIKNSYGQFVHFLDYKMTNQGKRLVIAHKLFPSSKLCSQCGYVNKILEISERTWICPQCRTLHHRDFNAAINLSNYLLQPQEMWG